MKYIYINIWKLPEPFSKYIDTLDDDEYEAVADAFDELLDSQEYDELIPEDELDD